jgi:signal transduction histidine kinase
VRRALVLAGGTLIALMAATAAGNPFGPSGGGFYLIPALIAAPLFGGIAVSNRRALVNSIQARADEEARRRVDEERLRIARELHDIVAHTMATINVQAGVAAHVLSDDPAAAGDALQAIRQSSKDGLRELRAILNVLRQADEADPTQPAPGLAQLDALIARTREAGLPTTLRHAGEPVPLPPAADLAAYRIVQESLTNVIKHAGPASAQVDLSYDDGALRIEVTDTGVGPAAWPGAGGGQGIIGMRERAASVGGALEAGPGPAAGYRVRAVLPADPRQAADPAEPEPDVTPGARTRRAATSRTGRMTPS